MTGQFKVTNPATEGEVGVFQRASLDQLQETARASRSAFEKWRKTSLEERIALIKKFVTEFENQREKIARDISLQMGKPLSQAQGEVSGTIERATSMADQATVALAPRRLNNPDNLERYVERIPRGVVLNMAAWNYPLLIAVNVVVPAILAGNSVILKHSARTPLCGEIFAEIFKAIGAPENLVVAVQADHDTIQKFVGSGAVDYTAFTGSVPGGRAVQMAARERFMDLGLELGGKDPAYVMADQDNLEWTAANLAEGFCYNAGQSCCAIERIYVHEKVYDPFLELLVKNASTFKPGDPLAEGVNMGPLVSAGGRQHLENQVADALKKGATEILAGGPTDINGKGFFYNPRVLVDVNHGMDLMREENFGPIMGVIKVKDDSEALKLMNDSAFGLTASVWGGTKDAALSMISEIQAGTVFWNRCDFLDPELPWTGYGDSGAGSTLGHEGFAHLTKPRAIHLRLKQG